MGKGIIELTKSEFENFIKKDLVIIDFFAEWCMPCLTMSPIFEELNNKFGKKIKFGKVNVGEEQEISEKFNISSIPQFLLFENGKVIDKIIGAVTYDEIENRLIKYIK